MSDFDKPRCVRIISDTIESIDEVLKEHHETVDYDDPETMLRDHAELELDKAAMLGLKGHLENDCS